MASHTFRSVSATDPSARTLRSREQVFYNATKSKGGTSALAAIVALLTLFTSIN